MFYDETPEYKSYLPDFFQDAAEIDALNGAVNIELGKLNACIKAGVNNKFPSACDEIGCARWEKVLGISQVMDYGKLNLFDKSKVTESVIEGFWAFIHTVEGGVWATPINARASDYIAVSGGNDYAVTGNTFAQWGPELGSILGLAWYDANKAFLNGVSYCETAGNGTYRAPANAAYARYTIHYGDLSKSQFERGTLEEITARQLQARRNAIKARMMTMPPVNLNTLGSIIEAYMGLSAGLSIDGYNLHIKYRGTSKIADLKPLFATIRETVPANILFDIEYAYLLWTELDGQDLTFAQLDAKEMNFTTLERGEWIV